MVGSRRRESRARRNPARRLIGVGGQHASEQPYDHLGDRDGETPATTNPIVVLDDGTSLAFSCEDVLRYSGPGSPAGVALAHQAMQCGFPLLDSGASLERREITTETAFRGPGARDAFELVTRGVTEGRYIVDRSLEHPERGTALEAFAFRLADRHRR